MAKLNHRSVKSKKLVVKKGTDYIEIPFEVVKSILVDAGYSGELLVKATGNVFLEAARLTKKGVIHFADFEKAVVNSIKKTNDLGVDAAKKVVKRVVK